MKWRNSKFKLILVCLLTAGLMLGLYGIAQADIKPDGKLSAGGKGEADVNITAEAGLNPVAPENPVVPAPYFGAIKGQVREYGELPANPIGNALVAAWRVGQAGGSGIESGAVDAPGLEVEKVLPQPVRPHYVRWTVTDKSGFYALADLPPGIYLLGCFADWYQPAYARVEVKAGETTEQNFALRGPLGALGGRVTQDGCNNPVPGATILALPKDRLNDLDDKLKLTITPQQKEALKKAAAYEARTDRNGYYFIPFVKPGEYWVIAIKGNMYAYQEAKVAPRAVTMVNLCLRLPISPEKKVRMQGEADLKGEVKLDTDTSATGPETNAGTEISGNAGISNDSARRNAGFHGQINAGGNAPGCRVGLGMMTDVDAYDSCPPNW